MPVLICRCGLACPRSAPNCCPATAVRRPRDRPRTPSARNRDKAIRRIWARCSSHSAQSSSRPGDEPKSAAVSPGLAGAGSGPNSVALAACSTPDGPPRRLTQPLSAEIGFRRFWQPLHVPLAVIPASTWRCNPCYPAIGSRGSSATTVTLHFKITDAIVAGS
jgi:hypothetical protein